MINVGIAGSVSSVDRHRKALTGMPGLSVTGLSYLNGSRHEAAEMDHIIEKSDAIIITDAGSFSSELAVTALRKAKHLFLYPSVLSSPGEAYQLMKLSREANVILKCGKTGNFNVQRIMHHFANPLDIRMIELQHIMKLTASNPSKPLSEIILEDMEIIINLIHARNTTIKAKGLCMLSSQPDIINARLEFDNGSAVNYFCSTVGTQNDYHISMMLKGSVLNYSMMDSKLTGWYLNSAINKEERPIFIEETLVEQPDYLCDNLHHFFNLIHSGPAFLSIYDNGFESFVLTDRILEKVSKTLVQFA